MADVGCCLSVSISRAWCAKLDQREELMGSLPRTTPVPAVRQAPEVHFMSAVERAKNVTTAELVLSVPADAVRFSDKKDTSRVYLWAQELPKLIRDLNVAVKPACGGKSIIQMVEDALDAVVARLMTEPAEDGRDPGRAEGLAVALSIFYNPYAPNLDEQRAAAMERFNNRAQ